MKLLRYVFETRLDFSQPASDHSFVLRCLPRCTNAQKVLESQAFTHPRIPVAQQLDGFGNRILVGYCPDAHSSFDYHATGLVMVDAADATPEPAHPMYLQPTPLTMPNHAIRAFARQVAQQVEGKAGSQPYAIALLASSMIYETFEYVPGVTSICTTAAEAFTLKAGVCQDYAHVLISVCRELGIPARYVTGLMIGEGATHAWVEVHDGTRWRGIDPTHSQPIDDGYMVFALGRDFDDCPIERGVFRGDASQEQRVSATLRQTQE